VSGAKAWWNRAAQEDARWYIATASDPFFERGRRDANELVAFGGLQPSKDKTLLELGAGAGRMTHRFAELYGRVLALDVSEEMLRLGRGNLAGAANVESTTASPQRRSRPPTRAWALGRRAASGGAPAVPAPRSVDRRPASWTPAGSTSTSSPARPAFPSAGSRSGCAAGHTMAVSQGTATAGAMTAS
jgi:SAM-dependent methyltransferase